MTATVPVNLEGGPQCYQHAGWQDGAARKWHIRHGFFTANGGVSTGLYQSLNCGFGSNDDPALIAENRRRVANSLGFQPDQMFGLRQTHSASVVKIDSTSDASIDARADADALITNNSGYALAILTADCVPVLFAAPEMGVIGAAHAGWRGAVDGVLEATIAMMAKQGSHQIKSKPSSAPPFNRPIIRLVMIFAMPFLQRMMMLTVFLIRIRT